MGVRPGPDRRRAVTGRLRGGRVRRLAARAAAARRGRGVPVRAAVRPGRGAHGRRHPRIGARSCWASGCATTWATRWACSTASGGGVLVACLGLRLVWIGGAVALQTPGRERPARLHPALGDPARAQRACCRRPGRSCAPSRASTRSRTSRARRRDVAAARRRASRATRRCAPPARSVVKVLGTACGLGVQGSGWVAGDGVVVTNAHVVAGQDDTTVQLRGAGPAPRRPGDLVRLPQRPGGAARARRSSGAPALRLDANAPEGTSAAILGLPRERPLPRDGRAARAHGDRGHPGRLRARPGAALDHVAARPRPPGQLGRAGGRRRRARGHDDLRRDGLGRRAQRLRRARRVVADALRSAGGPVDTGPCAYPKRPPALGPPS